MKEISDPRKSQVGNKQELTLRDKLTIFNDWLLQRSSETGIPVGPIHIKDDIWSQGDGKVLEAIKKQIKGIAERPEIPPELLPK